MNHSTIQKIPSKPGSAEELRKSLNELSQRAIQTDVKDPDQVTDLALGFRTWAEGALSTGTDWCKDHYFQTQEIILQLKNGVPPSRLMEKLLRLLLLSHRLLEKSKESPAHPPETETDAPPPFRRSARKIEPSRKAVPAAPVHSPVPEPLPGQMNILPEDLGFFSVFLLDVPLHLEEAQMRLAGMVPGEKADVSPLYRPLHLLRGQFGYLGFLGIWRLGREMERLLDPLMGGRHPLNGDLKDAVSQVLSFLRAQAERIEEGLPARAVDVLDPSGLLEKIKTIPTPAASITMDEPFHLEPETERAAKAPGFYNRISFQELDGLFENLVDLALAQNRILDDYRPNAKPQGLAEIALLQKAMMHLREGFLSLGMSPVEPLLAQAVQEAGALARRKNQVIEINVEGSEVELDQRLLPELKEPLFRLIQNAMDHGFESPRDRRVRGKSAEGRLTLRASHKDGAFLLEVEDDGFGLEPERIKQRAVQLGWMPDEKLPLSRLQEFIFKPGFSSKNPGSAEAGTGLDTVRRKMESLLGSVRVQSRPGQGCKFTLKMPRSMALMEGWVVQAAGKKYLLPVAQTLKIEPVDTGFHPKSEEMIPEVHLARVLGGDSESPAGKLAVLAEAGFQRVRLRVDEVPGKQQALVKNNKEGFSAPPGARAEALLTDGTTGWILDIASLSREERGENPLKGISRGNETAGGI
jgi:two-component system chemotaxis sensor kinase CheA